MFAVWACAGRVQIWTKQCGCHGAWQITQTTVMTTRTGGRMEKACCTHAVDVSQYSCIYVYIYLYIYMYTHNYMYIYISLTLYVCLYVYITIHIYIYIHM